MAGEWLSYVAANAEQPMFGGYVEPGYGSAQDFNMPGVPAPLSLALQLWGHSLYGGGGFLPAQFMPQQNLVDQYNARAYWAARQSAMQRAAQADVPALVQLQRGLLQGLGVPWTMGQQSFAAARAQDMAGMLPLAAQLAPQLVDSLFGLRGSATVMAAGIHQGGRLAMDPVTGRAGLSGASAGEMSAAMAETFFGAQAQLGEWRGISAGQAGQLYAALQQRGLVGASIAAAPRERQSALMGAAADLPQLLAETAQTSPAAFDNLLTRVERAQRKQFTDVRSLRGDDQLSVLAQSEALAQRLGLGGLSQQDRMAHLRGLQQRDADRYGALVQERFTELLRGRGIADRLSDPVLQITEMAETGGTALDALQRLRTTAPQEYQRLLRKLEQENPARPLGGLSPEAQLAELGRDRQLSADAMDFLRQRNPQEYQRLLAAHDVRRPGGSLKSLSREDQVLALSQTEHIAESAIREIERTDPVRFEALLRQFDATKVANRLKGLSGAVAAMRDIFGDAGQPNAPMSALVEGLNQLTQGGLATMSPQTIEQTVRTAQALAKQTGLGLDALQGLTAQAAGRADLLGLDRFAAVQATQGAAAFGAAFGEVGHGDVPAFGRRSKEQLTLTDQQLRLQAAASPLANQLSATMRLADELGFSEGSDAARLAAALRQGQSEWVDGSGTTRSVEMAPGQWLELMQGGGVGRATAHSLLRDQYTNQEYGQRYGLGDVARQLQGQVDILPVLSQGFSTAIAGGLVGAGLSQAEAAKAARASSRAVGAALMSMDAETRRDTQRRNAALEEAIRGQLEAAGVDVAAVEQANPGALREMAIAGWGNNEQRIRTDPRLRYLESLQNTLDTFDPQVMARQREQLQQARVTGAMRSAVAGLGSAGPLRRLMEGVMSGQALDSMSDLMGQLFSGVDANEVLTRLTAVGQDESLGPRERTAAIVQSFLENLQQYERVDEAGVTPEGRRAALLELQRTDPQEYQRLVQARAKEQAQAGQPTSVLGLTGAAQTDAVLQSAQINQQLARRIRRQEQQRRVANLEALQTGGAAARRRAEELLREAGVSQEEQQLILAGKMLPPERLARDVRGLLLAAQGDTAAALADQGLVVGAKIEAEDLQDVATQGAKLQQRLKGGVQKEDSAGNLTDEYLQASGYAKQFAGRSSAVIETLLGDEQSLKALGKGGLDALLAAREKRDELGRLAAEKQMTVEDLLLSGDKQARELAQGLQADLTGLAKRREGQLAPEQRMDEAELDRWRTLRGKETLSPAQRVEAALGAMLDATGSGLGEQERAALAAGVLQPAGVALSPAEQLARVRETERALQARTELEGLAKSKDMTLAELQQSATQWLGGMRGEERERVQTLLRQAGALTRVGADEGTGYSAVEGALQETLRKRVGGSADPATDVTGGQAPQRITGTLKILRDNTAELNAVGGVGSTPVAF